MIIVGSGANVNAITEETRETALTLAACGGFMECCKLLIEGGAELELGCTTPLMEAAQEGHVDLIHYFVEQGEITTQNIFLLLSRKFCHLLVVKTRYIVD